MLDLKMGFCLALGGPKDGQFVDWPVERHYYEVLKHGYNALTGETYTKAFYQAHRVLLFNYECYIWVYEDNKNENWEEKLLENILSFKGAQVLFSGKQLPPPSSLLTPRFQDK